MINDHVFVPPSKLYLNWKTWVMIMRENFVDLIPFSQSLFYVWLPSNYSTNSNYSRSTGFDFRMHYIHKWMWSLNISLSHFIRSEVDNKMAAKVLLMRGLKDHCAFIGMNFDLPLWSYLTIITSQKALHLEGALHWLIVDRIVRTIVRVPWPKSSQSPIWFFIHPQFPLPNHRFPKS